MSRICWICKIEKPLIEFYKDRKDKLGYQKRCKECNKTTNKKFTLLNPTYFSEKQKEKFDSFTVEDKKNTIKKDTKKIRINIWKEKKNGVPLLEVDYMIY